MKESKHPTTPSATDCVEAVMNLFQRLPRLAPKSRVYRVFRSPVAGCLCIIADVHNKWLTAFDERISHAGVIPSTFGALSALSDLDLSKNKLSGGICGGRFIL